MPKGIYPGNKGKKLTKEHRAKVIKTLNPSARKGKAPWNKGKKGLQVAWNKGKHPSKETLRKMSIGLKGKLAWNKGKPFLKLEKNPAWKGGISFEPYSIDWTETLRRSIRERDNYICQLCNQYGNTVHHINYDKKNCNPDNLITLCNRCNIKVNLNRDYWKEFFKNKLKCFPI